MNKRNKRKFPTRATYSTMLFSIVINRDQSITSEKLWKLVASHRRDKSLKNLYPKEWLVPLLLSNKCASSEEGLSFINKFRTRNNVTHQHWSLFQHCAAIHAHFFVSPNYWLYRTSIITIFCLFWAFEAIDEYQKTFIYIYIFIYTRFSCLS